MISKQVAAAIGGISLCLAAGLIWLIYFHANAAEPEWVTSLPAANATLNFLSAVCLVAGYFAIRSRQQQVHRSFMLAATGFSTLFLASYVTYHFFHGDTRFPGQGWIRPVYFTLLISHIGLSIVALPLILTTLYLALGGRFASHRRVAQWTFPIWLYVSVTGVLVFLVLNAYKS